uniref:Ras-GAP domain-containing protein n=1 Tax=Soboliphyme baturini TaxID=241478 RepID=A0A183J4U0_9BILA
LTAIEVCFNSGDDETRLAVTDIFAYIVDYNVSVVREYALSESMNNQKSQFFNLVIDQMFNDPDPELGAAMQLAGALKTLVDPETLIATAQSKYGKSDFLSYFYNRCMDNLCSPLLSATTEDKLVKDCYRTANLLSLVLDLISFGVERHSSYMRNFIIYRDLLKRVLLLLKSRHSFLALCE